MKGKIELFAKVLAEKHRLVNEYQQCGLRVWKRDKLKKEILRLDRFLLSEIAHW